MTKSLDFLAKISTLDLDQKFRFLVKISIFDVDQKFRFLAKFSIFDIILYFWRKFLFMI